MDVLPLDVTFATNVEISQATNLDSEFFDEEDLEFGRDVQEDVVKNPFEWFRTTSGRAATVVMQAEDEDEKVGVLQFVDGASEIRRFQSYKPCLFGPELSSDAEDFDSDEESETDTDTEDLPPLPAESEDEESEILEDPPAELPNTDVDEKEAIFEDLPAELPHVTIPNSRRNRGVSWLKMNSLGELFDPEKEEEEEPKKRLVMDAFGNFVIAGSDEMQRRDPHLEYLKMRQTRRSSAAPESKRRPLGSPISKRSGIKSRLKSFFRQ